MQCKTWETQHLNLVDKEGAELCVRQIAALGNALGLSAHELGALGHVLVVQKIGDLHIYTERHEHDGAIKTAVL